MKHSIRIKRAAIAVALVLAAPAAHAGWSNGLIPNGIGPNGFEYVNGFELANGFSGNGLGSVNGFEAANGIELANGINSTNGLDRNGLARKAVSDQPAHKTGCEGIDRHVFCRSANPFSGLSIKPLGAPAHDAAVK
jgi:hypothetical protein